MAYIKLKRINGDNVLVNADMICAVSKDGAKGSKILLIDYVIEVTETVTYIENLIAQNCQVASSLETQ